jgi:protein tyrosine/serine phosphatase
VKDESTGKFYVHCAGGRHRTGVMGAVYRFNFYQWNYDQVYKEMKAFDYYSRWGHGALKEYVQDYYTKIQTANVQTSTDAATQSNR